MNYWMIVAAVDRGPRTYMNMVNVKASYRTDWPRCEPCTCCPDNRRERILSRGREIVAVPPRERIR